MTRRERLTDELSPSTVRLASVDSHTERAGDGVGDTDQDEWRRFRQHTVPRRRRYVLSQVATLQSDLVGGGSVASRGHERLDTVLAVAGRGAAWLAR